MSHNLILHIVDPISSSVFPFNRHETQRRSEWFFLCDTIHYACCWCDQRTAVCNQIDIKQTFQVDKTMPSNLCSHTTQRFYLTTMRLWLPDIPLQHSYHQSWLLVLGKKSKIEKLSSSCLIIRTVGLIINQSSGKFLLILWHVAKVVHLLWFASLSFLMLSGISKILRRDFSN